MKTAAARWETEPMSPAVIIPLALTIPIILVTIAMIVQDAAREIQERREEARQRRHDRRNDAPLADAARPQASHE